MAFSSSTLDHLDRVGLKRGDSQADRAGIGRRVVSPLFANPAADLAEAATKAQTAAELGVGIFGTVTDPVAVGELSDLVRTGLSPEGHGQKALDTLHEMAIAAGDPTSERMVLLSLKVERTITNGSGPGVPVKVTGYFVTNNPDLIRPLMWSKSGDRVVSGLRTTNRRVKFTSERVPALNAHKPGFYGELERKIAAELPAAPPAAPSITGGQS